MSSWRKNGGGGYQGSAQNWQCRACDEENWPKHKVCWKCRAMRTYAEVVSPSSTQSGQQQQAPKPQAKQANGGHALHLQMVDIATQLGSTLAGPASHSGANEMPSTTPTQTQEPQEPERQALVAKIRQLESSLASIPEGQECKHIKDAILAQIEQAKTRLNNTKPLAARLEGCQEALTRAQKRLTETQSLVQLAVAARDKASAQVTKLQAELVEVQALISKQAETAQGRTCLQKLHLQMQAVLSEMSSSTHLDVGETQGVMQQMGSLFNQLTGLAAKAQLSAQASVTAQSLEQQRLQQLLIENAIAKPVEAAPPVPHVTDTHAGSEAMAVDPSDAARVATDNHVTGEQLIRVITGGG